MTKSLTALALILMLFVGLYVPNARAYSCAKNHYTWTHKQVLEHPLEIYERLARRHSPDAEMGHLEFIRTDLQKAKTSAQVILKEKGAELAKEAEKLLEANAPYRRLLAFYSKLTNAIQYHHKSGLSYDEVGFYSNPTETMNSIRSVENASPKGLPGIILPMQRNFSMADFVRTNGVPLFFAGVTFKPKTMADSVNMGPADFFFHDIFHAELMMFGLRTAYQEAMEANVGVAPLAITRQWNQLANDRLNSETEAPMFEQMHETATVIR